MSLFTVGRSSICVVFALLVLLVQPASASEYSHRFRSVSAVEASLVDLAVDQKDPFDGAYAKARIVSRVKRNGHESTKVRLKVFGINADKGVEFGSHVHVGPCVEGDGAAAGPHFNITVSRGEKKVVSRDSEVWLDLKVNKRGTAKSKATVEFVIPSGEGNSIVIHEKPTDPSGGAGPRLACISI